MRSDDKQRGVAPVSDEAIIELYWLRDEDAIVQTDLKYKKYLYSVAYNVLHDPMDCEECLNDTYLGAWNAIPPSKPRALAAFLTTIARRIAINRYHYRARKCAVPSEMTVSLSELNEFLSEGQEPYEEYDAMRLGQVLGDFVDTLSQRQRFIFMGRYYVADPVASLAQTLGISRSMVNKELATIRKELKEVLEREGYVV